MLVLRTLLQVLNGTGLQSSTAYDTCNETDIRHCVNGRLTPLASNE
ncbi:hypothetical protein AA0113_g7371 [Alternaria arborescens]|uniref:Uncharacterized protein n=1 Tax=Alternaria arborescens TaxID=156630 RepID=A0A4V1X4M0_9PLEO|nr:hypothetical protein AA0113_g7371 [Alternaria arborescens]